MIPEEEGWFVYTTTIIQNKTGELIEHTEI